MEEITITLAMEGSEAGDVFFKKIFVKLCLAPGSSTFYLFRETGKVKENMVVEITVTSAVEGPGAVKRLIKIDFESFWQ